jgi:hypothetical protein
VFVGFNKRKFADLEETLNPGLCAMAVASRALAQAEKENRPCWRSSNSTQASRDVGQPTA